MATPKKLFRFRQNNSGGNFIVNDTVDVNVVIEAESADQANEIATRYLGIYFNGVDNERDCSCCGDRWLPVEERDGSDKVQICPPFGIPFEWCDPEEYTAQYLKDNMPPDTRFYYFVGDTVVAHHMLESKPAGELDEEEKN